MLVKDTGEKKRSIKVVLTGHAMERISERFGVGNYTQITDVLSRALKGGLVSADGNGTLIEYGCLLIVGNLNDGVFRVRTVFNLSQGVPKRLKEQLRHTESPPWNNSRVILPDGRRGDAS